jgi:hypothetical protein
MNKERSQMQKALSELVKLAVVQGTVNIQGGLATLPNGEIIDIAKNLGMIAYVWGEVPTPDGIWKLRKKKEYPK